MTAPRLHFRLGPDQRPIAETDAPGYQGLATFLTTEANWPEYIGLLLDHAAAAARTHQASVSTGNAFQVTFTNEYVTIEHLHRVDWPAVTMPADAFATEARAWRAWLLAHPA